MPWLTRPDNSRDYYTTRTVQGRKIRTYIGRGSVAEQAAAEARRRQAERQKRTQARRDLIQRHTDGAHGIVTFTRAIDMLTRSTLISVGFYQHRRGEWRRRSDVRSRQS